MAPRGMNEAIPLKKLRLYNHQRINTFKENEGLVEAIANRPGIYGPNPIAYLSLMARRPKITPGDLDEALLTDRSLVRAGAFRSSLFLLKTEDLSLYHRAYSKFLEERGMNKLVEAGFDRGRIGVFAKKLRDVNFERTKDADEILEMVLSSKERKPADDVSRQILRKLCDLGVLIRTASRGWKGNTFSYAMLSTWLEDYKLRSDQGEAARVEVTRRYFRLYGPAYPEDAAAWTGFSLEDTHRYIAQMGREAIRFKVNNMPDGLIGSRESIDGLRKDIADEFPVIFVPVWDLYSMAWSNKSRLVRDPFLPWTVDARGNTTSLVLENGRAIGVWQFRDAGEVTLEFHVFEPYMNRVNAVRMAADAFVNRLSNLVGIKNTRVLERALPQPLSERKAGAFLWPLGRESVEHPSLGTPLRSPMDRRSSTTTMRSSFLDDKSWAASERAPAS